MQKNGFFTFLGSLILFFGVGLSLHANAVLKDKPMILDMATCEVIVVVYNGVTYYYYDPTDPACRDVP